MPTSGRTTRRSWTRWSVALWADPALKQTVAQRSMFQLNDSAEYFFDSVRRTLAPGYVPTDEDIVRARVRTTGIVETKFEINRTFCRIFDVGGQRSERKKWIHCFEAVDILLFVASIAEYDQQLFEDETVPRLTEALTVFEAIANSRWFSRSTVVLFLNKIDLLEAKLPRSSLRAAFPRYDGDDLSLPDACNFFRQMFATLYAPQQKKLYSHFTCATDRAALTKVMNIVADMQTRANIIAPALL